VASLALIMAALPTLARSMRRDPAETILLGAGCPLILMSLVGGAHNDALMIALLVAGLALAQRGRTVPGIILCALAAGVKSPAALGVLFLGWVWAGREAKVWQRLLHTAGAGVIGLLTMEVMAVVSGTGWGWLKTSTAADQSFTDTTPIDAVARFVNLVGDVIRVHIPLLGTRTVLSVIGLIIAGLIGVWLLHRAPYDGIPRTLGLSLLVVALLGPILWAWYITWGVIVLAPAASPTLRRVLITLITFETFSQASKVNTMLETLYKNGLLGSLITVAALFALVIIPLAPFSRWHLPTLRWPLTRGRASLVPTTPRTD
jgi:alpha-1,6-mannosyltransferase